MSDTGTTVDDVAATNGDDEGHRTPVPMPIARMSDPHLQEAARYPTRVERMAAVAMVLGILATAGFGVAYWQNANQWILGATFGAGLLLLGFGLTTWGKYLMPQGPFVEERHTLASTPAERDAMSAALVQRSGIVVKRRRMLGGLLAAGLGVFGIVALFPLLRSLGPVPGTTLTTTNWKRGTRLVDSNGRPIKVDELGVGGIQTVFPEGQQYSDEGQAVDQTVLIRVGNTDLVTQPGRETWAPRGYVAYSKVCTHAGCPVGLYEQQLQLLVCPCHQSMFDVTNGAVPKFGPAPRPLPQLPLAITTDGYLVAQAGYDQPVGPGYWERNSA